MELENLALTLIRTINPIPANRPIWDESPAWTKTLIWIEISI